MVSAVPWSVSKLQGQHFGGPSCALPFQGTSGQFWEQLSCAWKMSSAFGNYTFLLTPGVLSRAISMTNRWDEVQLGHQKWFAATHWAGPWGGKAILIARSGRNQESQSLPRPPHNLMTTPLPCGSCIFYCILLNFILFFTNQNSYIFQLKKRKKNTQTENFGKNSQWNVSHLTPCCHQAKSLACQWRERHQLSHWII